MELGEDGLAAIARMEQVVYRAHIALRARLCDGFDHMRAAYGEPNHSACVAARARLTRRLCPVVGSA